MESMMVTMKVWEHRGSQPTTRRVPFSHGHRMGLSGSFHRVLLLTEWDEILMDFRNG
jgi:hypothetical protein